MIALRLVRAHSGLFAALAATAAVAGALAVGVPGYLVGTTTSATRTGFADLSGSDGAYRVGVRLTDHAVAQDAAVRRMIARTSANVPLDVFRTLGTDDAIPIRISRSGAADPRGTATLDALVRSDADLARAARLTDGSWPTSADEASLQADAAARLGVTVGSTVSVGDPEGTPRDVTVSALWRARDPDAPRWAGDPSVRTGRDGTASGPLVVAPSLWNRIDVTPLARWTIVPDARRSTPASLDVLERIDSTLPDALRASSLGASGVTTDGRLPEGARGIARRVTAVLATAPVSAIVLAALAFLALVELARLLLFSRARETLLLRSRGASSGRLAGSTALEAAAIGIVAGAIGGTVAAVAAGAATGIPVSPVLVIIASAGVALVAAGVFGSTTWRAAREALTREQVADSGRRRRLASIGVVVLVAAAAVLSSVQFLRDGSPLVSDAERVARIDPLAAPAPALAIVAVALLAIAVAPLAARIGTGILDRGDGLGTLLARRLRRGLAGIATGVVLVALASALLVSAAAYSATLDRASRDNRALGLGADVTASGTTAERLSAAAAEIRAPSAPASVTDATVDERAVRLVGAPARRLPSVATDGGTLDLDALARAVTAPAPGVALPDGAGTLTMTVAASPVAPSSMTLRMLTADGVPIVASGTPEEDGAVAIRIPARATRLAAIEALLPTAGSSEPDASPVITTIALSDLRTDRGALDTGAAWTVPYVSPEPPVTTLPSGGLGARVAVDPGVRTTVRLMPASTARIPVAIAQDLARATGLHVGSGAAIGDGGAEIRVVVRSVVPAIPGGGGTGILADAAALRSAELRGSDVDDASLDSAQLWVRGTDGDAARLRAELPSTATVQSADDSAARGAVASASAGLWIGTAGALLLAAIAVAAVVGADLRAREVDVAVLRALGVDARRQARDRAIEHLAVLGWGLVVGLLGGLGTSALLVPGLARAAVADRIPGLPIGLAIDPVGLGAGVVALVIALGLILSVVASRLAARGGTAVVAEAVG